ncbi:MAG: efflux RND transporter periplasmic adaptor subunit [Bacteroidales bacterium]|nr:efflux RND transporter periplasmic adaptor subunit [Bacteroidales bacterium]
MRFLRINKLYFYGLLCFAVTSCNSPEGQQSKKGHHVPVTVITPKSIDMPETFVADVQAVQFVEIKAKVEGFVQEICVDEGQRVHKGQVLFRLSSIEYTEDVKRATANLKQAQVKVRMADYEIDRLKRLVDKKIISKVRLDLAYADREVAESEVQQAKSQLQNAQTHLSYTIITSPVNGIIDRIPYKTGSLVSPGNLLTTVTNVSEVFAYFKVNESQYLKYKRNMLEGDEFAGMGDITLILSDGSIYPYKGRVETIEGDFERSTGSIAFRARFPNPDGLLKHGVTGKVRLQSRMDDIFLIPHKSTFEIQDFTYVYVVDSTNTVKVRSFVPLARYGNFYVSQDFDNSVSIVYEGVQTVKDGMHIVPDTVDFTSIVSELNFPQDTNR